MKILFIINKGRRDQGPDPALIERFHSYLKDAGADYKISLCGSKEESEKCVTAAMEAGLEQLWIGGGDGTINHALNVTFGKKIAYGIVPMGTVNALAQALRMPLNPDAAVKYLLKADPVPMDIGKLNEYYFFTYATVGLHAAVFHNIDTKMKKRWGRLAFWDSAARTLWRKSRLPRFLMEMKVADAPSGEDIVRDYGYSFTLSNLANYAGFGTVTAEDAASPGYFELHHFRQKRLMPMFIWFALLRVLGKEKSEPESGRIFRLIRWVKIRSHHHLSVQVDGEPIDPKDSKNLDFTCLADAARILLREVEAGHLRLK